MSDKAARQHGDWRHYKYDGCVNDECRSAYADYERERRTLAKRFAPRRVASTEARRLLDSLRRQGWSLGALAARLGIVRDNLETVYEFKRIDRAKMQAIRGLHAALDSKAPDNTQSNHAGLSSTIAKKRGAVHAYAWYDIADRDETLDDKAPALEGAVTEYRGLALSTRRYLAHSAVAGLPDDGQLDEVAIVRTIHGQRNGARLTPREVVCIIYRAARNWASDDEIAALLGGITKDGVLKIRDRNGIESRYHEMSRYALAVAA